MKRKYIKNLVCVLVLGLLVLGMSITAFAAGLPEIDLSKRGSIALTLKENDTHKPIPGGVFTLYYVAKIDASGNNLEYVYTDEFKNNGMQLGDLRAEGLAVHLANHASDSSGINKTSDADGKVFWDDLDLGIYLIVQRGRVEGYYGIEPFLVTIPMSDKENNIRIYDVDASPKVEVIPEEPSETEVTVKKVWVDDGKNTPSSIEVKLYRDNEAYDSAVLNESNDWKKVWTGLDAGYTWTVKECKVPEGYEVKNYETSHTSSGVEFIITNTSTEKPPKTPPLIQTGQMNWPIPLLAGAGILIFAFGWFMTFMKRKK